MAADQLSKLNPDGTSFGQSATDKISFFGVTPVVRITISCVATGCVVATVLAKLNTLIDNLKRSYGMFT